MILPYHDTDRDSLAALATSHQSEEDGVFIVAHDRLIYVNPAGSRLLGEESPAQSVGMAWTNRLVAVRRPELADERAKRLEEDPMGWENGFWTDENGQRLAVLFRRIRLDDAAMAGTLYLIRPPKSPPVGKREDEEELLNAEIERLRRELANRERRLERLGHVRDALEHALDGFSRVRKDGTYACVNRSYASLLGYFPEDLVGRSVSDAIHPRDRVLIESMVEEMEREGRADFEVRAIRKDGSMFHGRMVLVPDRHGGNQSYYNLLQDITKRKVAEEALVRAHHQLEARVQERTAALSETNDRLRREISERRRAQSERAQLENQLLHAQKLEAVGLLAGGIAHDFNNLLTVILGNHVLLEETLQEQGDPELLQALGQIKDAGDRGAWMTGQLLAFCRKQAHKPEFLDPNDIVRDAERLLCHLVGERITFQTRLRSEEGCVYGDRGQIEQVLLNMVVNARDAISDHGDITIETNDVYLDGEYVATHIDAQEGPHVRITVEDNGPGIPNEIRHRIFEPFFTTKAAGAGTGLGLSTTYGIVRQAEGSICVCDRPGGGTRFHIHFPLRVPSTPTSEQAP